MSTVVGCTDCITSAPALPTTSMRVKVSVSKGYNGIIQQATTANANFPADNISSDYVVIPPSGTYKLPTGFTALVINSSGPLALTLTKGTNIQVFSLNSLFVLDTPQDALTVSNQSTTTSVSMSISYAYSNPTA